jgi:hypothetical protein
VVGRYRAEGEEMMADDPFECIDESGLTEADKLEIERLRKIYETEGEDGLVAALQALAPRNSTLFTTLLFALLD